MVLTRVAVASLLFLVLPALAGPSTIASTPAAVAAAIPALPSDFNGDGVEDLLIGVRADGRRDIYRTGGVHVIYGTSPDGTEQASQYFGLRGPPLGPLMKQYPSSFGDVMTSGDFDRDGYADAAIAVPGYDEPDVEAQRINVGAVVVLYGSAAGLDPEGPQPVEVWSQDDPRVQGVSEDDDGFGSALAVGDYDGDAYLDLAIGIEGEQTGLESRNTGAVTVLFGNAGGLTSRDQVVDQDTRGILDASETDDYAGGSLAAGDFDGDGVDDLALGVSAENIDGRRDAGAVNVIYGTRDVGLTGQGDRFFNQGLENVEGQPRAREWFGAALAVGDFDGDGMDDLVAAAPWDRIAGMPQAGSFTVLPGSLGGLRAGRSTTFDMRDFAYSPYLAYEEFARALATGDVNGDGFDELAIGSPFAEPGGRIDLLSGTADGLSLTGRQVLEQPQDPGFGSLGDALQLAEFDTTPGSDLLIGMWGAYVAHETGYWQAAGSAVIFSSRGGRITQEGYRLLHQGIPPVGGIPDRYEEFGGAVPGSTHWEAY